MATPEQFTRRMFRRSRQVRGAGVRILQRAASNVLDEVVPATPEDTGETKAGWVVGLGSPRRSEPGARDKAGSATIAAGKSVLTGLRRSVTVFISNSTDAIVPLDRRGTSPQASAGFVRAAVERAGRGLLDKIRIFI